ncbi:protein LONGIFOLIA 1-like [Cornus florida]|uniref:protein LONGIFOLIA 1-like n=1 Tax=Cornus florida TaxID=4283 RepID=UPI0028972D78|nr:protein LONGIFOLIA 1-like [Cornus florida]
MSAKFIYSLTEENPDMQKHIGCMNGIFQIFDRHHFLARRRVSGHNHKRLPPGQSANHGLEPNRTTQKATEKDLKDAVKEKQRVSVDSSTTSFSSSSCSSTFSSIDRNRTAQPDTFSFGHSISPKTLSQTLPMKQQNSSLQSARQSPNLRDVVKDSIYREPHGLSVKTISKEERIGHVKKHIDSPRPSQLSKSDKDKVFGLDESFQVLAKIREAPRNSSKEKDGPLSLTVKDATRFSYDERESRDILKSNIKIKELPRLSLDSRAGSTRSCSSESRANFLLGDLERANRNCNKILHPQQEPGSNKRSSIIVAKLMGLEAFPDSMPTNEGQIKEIKSCTYEDSNGISRLSRIADDSKQSQVSGSPRISQRDPISPRLRHVNSIIKPNSNSRSPLEPVPRRKPEGSQFSQKPAFIYREAQTKAHNPSPTVYGEIEKRLTELEFKKSGKDLRALKQIIEAMEKTRKRSESKREEHVSNVESPKSNYSPGHCSLDQSSKITTQRSQNSNFPISPTIRGPSSPRRSESPIVIIKPAKLIERPRNSGCSTIPNDGISCLRKLRTGDSANSRKGLNDKQTAKDLTPRSNHLTDPSGQPLHSMKKSTSARTLRSMPISKATQHMMIENPTISGRSSDAISPRLQQKKHVVEKQSRPTTSSSVRNRARQQNRKQPTESGSESRRLKPKSPSLRQGSEKFSEISYEMQNLSCESDAVSLQSESNISLASQIDTESSSCCNQVSGIYQQKDQRNQNLAARLSEDKSVAELTTANLDQPSPVSVLDATFYIEDLPSPVKKISNAFKDDENLNSNGAEWNPVDQDHLLNSTRPNLSTEVNHKKLEDVKHLVHKLKRLNFNHDEATTGCIASISENTNSDHRYITEMLLASGFLKNLGSSLTTIQLHPSGHLINPNLFLVLEQTKGSTELQNNEHSHKKVTQSKSKERIQRKLVFDTVNEILVHKLASPASSEVWISPNRLKGRRSNGQKLLEELCSEIDRLQANRNCSSDDECLISFSSEDKIENWTDYSSEVPQAVLDIERLIFKDLINEVVSCEVAGLQGQP